LRSTSLLGGTIDEDLGGACAETGCGNSSFGVGGRSLFGAGGRSLGFDCGAETIVVKLGVDDEESGCESVDFLLWKENWDFVAAEPFFMAVSDGTRRPRGRFSESKIAIFSGERRSWESLGEKYV
jgi:hypothetical protein